MKLVKKTSNLWTCYSDNRTEFDSLVLYIDGQFGICKHKWDNRFMSDEEAKFANYYAVIDIYDRHIATMLHLTYG